MLSIYADGTVFGLVGPFFVRMQSTYAYRSHNTQKSEGNNVPRSRSLCIFRFLCWLSLGHLLSYESDKQNCQAPLALSLCVL